MRAKQCEARLVVKTAVTLVVGEWMNRNGEQSVVTVEARLYDL